MLLGKRVEFELTCYLVAVLVAHKLKKTFGDVDENHFLVFFLLRQARIERAHEVVDARQRILPLVAVLVEHGVQVAVGLRLLDLVGERREVDDFLNALHQVTRSLLEVDKKLFPHCSSVPRQVIPV